MQSESGECNRNRQFTVGVMSQALIMRSFWLELKAWRWYDTRNLRRITGRNRKGKTSDLRQLRLGWTTEAKGESTLRLNGTKLRESPERQTKNGFDGKPTVVAIKKQEGSRVRFEALDDNR